MDIYQQSNQIKSRKYLKRDWNINITKKTHSWIKERFETYVSIQEKTKNVTKSNNHKTQFLKISGKEKMERLIFTQMDRGKKPIKQ
jgi:hypothetical protein